MSDPAGWISRYNAKRRRLATRSAESPPAAFCASAHPGEAAVATGPTPDVIAAATAKAVAADRVRIRSILEAPEAKGREGAAAQLAFETGLEAAKVRQMLDGMQLDVEEQAAAIVTFGRRPR